MKMGDEIGICYDESDFIDYLNRYICDEPSTLIAAFPDALEKNELPPQYTKLPYFNF